VLDYIQSAIPSALSGFRHAAAELSALLPPEEGRGSAEAGLGLLLLLKLFLLELNQYYQ
jgi:hypothetical protein